MLKGQEGPFASMCNTSIYVNSDTQENEFTAFNDIEFLNLLIKIRVVLKKLILYRKFHLN